MTREETKKCIEVMKHFEDGGEVQILVYDYGGRQEWEDCSNPDWNWDYHTYRKKPQSMKVTEEEKKIINRTIYWTKYKDTGNISYRYAKTAIEPNGEYILNPNTMEWEDWSEDTERLRHHYNGGQP